MGKGEIAGFQHSFLFPQSFQKTFSFRVFKNQVCLERVKFTETIDKRLGSYGLGNMTLSYKNWKQFTVQLEHFLFLFPVGYIPQNAQRVFWQFYIVVSFLYKATFLLGLPTCFLFFFDTGLDVYC